MRNNKLWCGVCGNFVDMEGTIREHYAQKHPNFDIRAWQSTMRHGENFWKAWREYREE